MTDSPMFSQGTASMSGVKPIARLAWVAVAYNIAVILWGAT